MTDLVEVLARAANEKMREEQVKRFGNVDAVSLPYDRLPAPWPEIERAKMQAALTALESAGYRVVPATGLFEAIAHGDDLHRAWLKEALDCFFAGKPVPPPRSAPKVTDSPAPEYTGVSG